MSKVNVIKKRLKSTRGTQQITTTMERIASFRIQKAQMRIEAARPYAMGLEEITRRLTAGITASIHKFPLLADRQPVRRTAVMVVASDRGLCGSYNSEILKKSIVYIKNLESRNSEVDIIAVGRRSAHYFEFINREVFKSFHGVTDNPQWSQALEIARLLMDLFISGQVDRVEIFYTFFKSLMSQVPTRLLLLPIEPPKGKAREMQQTGEMLIEPDPEAILKDLLPRYVETTVFRALLESSASEHAARRRAMKMASDNAGELIKVLTKAYNQARQASITDQIVEIISTKNAIESSMK